MQFPQATTHHAGQQDGELTVADVMFDFGDSIVVVTGAATGIGRATAEAFARAAGTVYLLDIDEDSGIEAAAGIGTFLATDVTSESSLRDAFSKIVETHERVDVLVNNAGGFGTQATTETIDPAEWRALIDLNLSSVFLACQAAIPALRQSPNGRIINIGSLAGLTAGYRTSPAYAAAKAGVHAFTRVLAHELAPDNVTVNAIAPSAVLTDRIKAVRDEDERASTAAGIPLGRYQSPDELAGWVLYLASPAAAFTTGQTISVNGGRFMT